MVVELNGMRFIRHGTKWHLLSASGAIPLLRGPWSLISAYTRKRVWAEGETLYLRKV